MNTVLIPERLIKSRKLLGLNKAEAARLLNFKQLFLLLKSLEPPQNT